MIDLKPEIFEALSRALSADRVFFVTPEEDAELPCITYMELNNVPSALADDAEYESEVEMAVDVWGNNSAEITAIAKDIDRELTAVGYLRTYATDIPPDELHTYHKNMRYRKEI